MFFLKHVVSAIQLKDRYIYRRKQTYLRLMRGCFHMDISSTLHLGAHWTPHPTASTCGIKQRDIPAPVWHIPAPSHQSSHRLLTHHCRENTVFLMMLPLSWEAWACSSQGRKQCRSLASFPPLVRSQSSPLITGFQQTSITTFASAISMLMMSVQMLPKQQTAHSIWGRLGLDLSLTENGRAQYLMVTLQTLQKD